MTTTLDYVVTTGDFIDEWMEREGINAAELARRLDVTPKHVSELLSGKAPLSHRMALSLERVTGLPARLWNMYEAGYRDALARQQSEEELAEQFEAAQEFPLTYLRRHGHLTASARDRAGTVRELLGLLGVASIDAFWSTWSHSSVAYRRSAVGGDHPAALAVWLRLGERDPEGLADLPMCDTTEVEALLPKLRGLTVDEPRAAMRDAQDLLASAGVALRFVPAVPGLGIHGATRWLHDRPVIQLSFLWKREDQLWFTLFHELGHVLLHGRRELHVLGDGSAAEAEADTFAAEVLIPSAVESRLPRRRDLQAVRDLAEELGVSPGIVLGRTQRITQDFAWGQSLCRSFEWKPDEGST